MWIKTTIGHYINTDNIFDFYLTELKSGDCAIVASGGGDKHFETIAILGNREDARKLLDRLMKKVGQVVAYSGSILSITLQNAGYYKFEVWGASGGTYIVRGGYGGYASGIKNMNMDSISILVGGKGISSTGSGNWFSSSGGGGTFIATGAGSSAQPIIIAGGGGGEDNRSTAGGNGGMSTSTNPSQEVQPNSSVGCLIGTSGAGFRYNGTWDTSYSYSTSVAKSYINGGDGAYVIPFVNYEYSQKGGFGGGGADGGNAGGGGGGFSAGNCGHPGNGGTSFISADLSNTNSIQGYSTMPNPRGSGTVIGNNGDGHARITYLGTSI